MKHPAAAELHPLPVDPQAPRRLKPRPPLLLLLALVALLLGQSAGAVQALTVVIDAGHGGHDRGGIPGQRVSEKVLALDVARRVNVLLKERGVRTVMTRSSDVFVSLPNRVAIGNRQRNAIFVSIHFNSARREGARGFETYYYNSAQGRRLARSIHARLLRTCRTEDRGVRNRGFYVLRKSRIPAVLVECGFLTNRQEAALCLQATHRQRMAAAIVNGIMSAR